MSVMSSLPFTRILYVEDDPDIQVITNMILASEGFEVLPCSSGQEALSKAITFYPELILLDVMMPGMDGPSTLAELRKNPEMVAVPVIFMTAKVQQHEVSQYLSLGSLGVVFKPFDPMTLCDELMRIWESKHG